MTSSRIVSIAVAAVLIGTGLVWLPRAGHVRGGDPAANTPASRPAALAGKLADKDKDEPPKKSGDDDLNQISLQVAALRTISILNLTPGQIAQVQELIKDVKPAEDKRKSAKANPKFRRALLALRDALIDGDDDSVQTLGDKVDTMRDDDDVDLDDGVEVVDSARVKLNEFIHFLTAPQVNAYLSAYDDDLPDPVSQLLSVLEDNVKAEGKDWGEARDSAADELGWQLGGVRKGRPARRDDAAEVNKQVKSWLDEKHKLSADELKEKHDELEKQIRQNIVKNVGPFAMLRNFLDHDLVELLSNPQLGAALKARQDKKG